LSVQLDPHDRTESTACMTTSKSSDEGEEKHDCIGEIEFQLHTFHDVSRGLASQIERKMSLTDLSDEGTQSDVIRPVRIEKPCYISSPNSLQRVCWDAVGTLCLALDAMVTPFELAFDIRNSLPLTYLSRAFLAYWTLDIFASFLTGIEDKNGNIIYSPRRICRRYFLTCLDLTSP